MYEHLMTKASFNSPLMGLLKLDQIAFAAYDYDDEVEIKRMLRLENADWVYDEVVAEGYVCPNDAGVPSTNKAKLLFNYDYGIEVEILRYKSGDNYLTSQGIKPRSICHVGFHIEKGNSISGTIFGGQVIQQVETISHTNPFLSTTGRRYRYTIYNNPIWGVNLKTIERIERNG